MARNVKPDSAPIDDSLETEFVKQESESPESIVLAQASSIIHTMVPEASEVVERLDAPKPKQYRVIQTPGIVMYNGCTARVMHNKVYPEGAVDLDLLRRQGVVFQEEETE